MTKGKRKPRHSAPWEEFEKGLTQLMTFADCGQGDAMVLLGYADSTGSTWKKDGKVPIVAMNALNGVLHDWNTSAQSTTEPTGPTFHIDHLYDPQPCNGKPCNGRRYPRFNPHNRCRNGEDHEMITTIAPRFATFRDACDYLAANKYERTTYFRWVALSGDTVYVRYNSDDGNWFISSTTIDADIDVLVHRWGIARVIAALARWAYHPTGPQPVIEGRKLATTARRLNAVYEYLQP